MWLRKRKMKIAWTMIKASSAEDKASGFENKASSIAYT